MAAVVGIVSKRGLRIEVCHENKPSKNIRVAEPIQLVWLWVDHFSKEVQNIFQLTKFQIHS